MTVLYLVLLAGWLLLVGVARGVLHNRNTGAAAVRFDDDAGSPQWTARLLGGLGLVFAVATPLAALAGLQPFGALDGTGIAILGVVLVLLGVVVTVVAQVTMGDSWRADVDPDVRTALVVHGPFRWVRNPIFSGTALTIVGLGLILPDVFAVGMVTLSAASWQRQVRKVEEPYLARTHGSDYARYASRTGRFLPGIGKLRSH